MAANQRRLTPMTIALAWATVGLLVIAIQPAGAAPATQINDPEAFVREVYQHFVAKQHGDYDAPRDIYTARLKALFVRDEKWAKGEVGCLEINFWVNGQDFELKNVRVTSKPVEGNQNRRTVIANFVNIDTAEEIHFDFQRIAGKWLLDDVQSVRAERWTLSKILMCPH